jgi:protein AbiQ
MGEVQMNNSMNWIILNEEYLDYLRGVEDRIPLTDYGDDKYKPFFGSLFETKDFVYVTQVSSVKKRHYTMTENIDFYKIYDPKNEKRILSVINLNYMFPVPKFETKKIENYKVIDEVRTFTDDVARSKYIKLLKVELLEINKKNLSENAEKIYINQIHKADSKLAARCFDYKLLEKMAYEWIDKIQQTYEETASTKENIMKS